MPIEGDYSEQLVSFQERDSEHRPDRGRVYTHHPVSVSRLGLDILYVDRMPIVGSARRGAMWTRRNRITPDKFHHLCGDVLGGDRPQNLTIEAKDEGALRFAQFQCAPN